MATDTHEPPAPLGASIRIFLANGVADGVAEAGIAGRASSVQVLDVDEPPVEPSGGGEVAVVPLPALGRIPADVGVSHHARRMADAA